MIVRPESSSRLCDETTLIDEVNARIQFPWLLEHEPQEKLLVLVWAHYNLMSYRAYHQVATELGIKLVVIDHEGHWLNKPQFRHLFEAFIPVDMTPDAAWHHRIASAVREYGHVDGIFAIATHCMEVVARAAALLDLPTQPPDLVAHAVSKYETRLSAGGFPPHSLALVDDTAHLKNLMTEKSFVPHFPLITKPNLGASSFQVSRANTEVELLEAVRRISQVTGQKVVVEPYIDGPELDVNLVLLDGELIFFEILVDYPCAGDDDDTASGTPGGRDFFETALGIPSRLPDAEYDTVRESLYKLLLQIGFTTGVFHLEARIQNSTMMYGKTEDGWIDLRPRSTTSNRCTDKGKAKDATCFLIEINARSPGFREATVSKMRM